VEDLDGILFLLFQDDMDVCRNSLLTVKGVISITFDFRKKRAMLRTVPDLRPEVRIMFNCSLLKMSFISLRCS